MTTKARLFLASPFLLSLALGCGPGNTNTAANVSGKVTYHDQPVTAGTVTFQPKGEVSGFPCAIAEDGTYTASNLPVGDMNVFVETESVNPAIPKPVYGPPGGGQPGGGQQQPAAPPPNPEGTITTTQAPAGKYVKIPAKYNDLKNPALTATLTAGKQTKDFNLAD